MITPTRMIELAYHWGHFNNPAHRTGVTLADLPTLRMSDQVVITAMESVQRFAAGEFDRRAAVHHDGRGGIPDGDVGPATRELFADPLTGEPPRCGHSDFPPEGEMATGRGSWPAGCHPDWRDNHAITVNVDKSGMPGFLGRRDDPESIFEQAWRLVRLSYADVGAVLIRADGDESANTTLTWTRGRGWIGLAQKPNRFSCGMSIWLQLDNRYQPSALLDQTARLLSHELAHNWGFDHITGGILNPWIVSGPYLPDAWRGDPALPKWVHATGAEPIQLEPDPPGPKPPAPGPPRLGELRGEIVLETGHRGPILLKVPPVPPIDF